MDDRGGPRVFHENYELKADFRCSTHVHVSTSVAGNGSPWTSREAAAILKAACLFEDSVVATLPPDRKNIRYAMSNFHSPHVVRSLWEAYAAAKASGDLIHITRFLDDIETVEEFAELYDSRPTRETREGCEVMALSNT
ncbi:hypothetical protein SCUCBS95973_001022 [Sporothrix curviconia]|uniref:Uncharacterized protein n=1 Tax=Sporothrix curviconia TaxID=1260050 RepID=A0ABP0AV30_9PEZI